MLFHHLLHVSMWSSMQRQGKYPNDVVRTSKYDVLRTSPKDILWTSPYGPLCNAKGHPLPTSWERPNMPSEWRPHIFLNVTCNAKGRPYWRSCRRYNDVLIRYNMQLQGTILPTPLLDVLKMFLHGSFSKAKKPPRQKDFHIWS